MCTILIRVWYLVDAVRPAIKFLCFVSMQAPFTISIVNMASATATLPGSTITTLFGILPMFQEEPREGNKYLTFHFDVGLMLGAGVYGFLLEFPQWAAGQGLTLAHSAVPDDYAAGVSIYKDTSDGNTWKTPAGLASTGDLSFYMHGSATAVLANGGCGNAGVCSGFNNVALSAAGNRVEIRGMRFGTDKDELSLLFNPAVAVMPILYAQDNLIVVDIGTTSSLTAGEVLGVKVTHASYGNSAGYVKVGVMSAALGQAPLLSDVTISATVAYQELTVTGQNLGSSDTDVKVYLSSSHGLAPFATVVASSVSPTAAVARIQQDDGLNGDSILKTYTLLL